MDPETNSALQELNNKFFFFIKKYKLFIQELISKHIYKIKKLTNKFLYYKN